MMHEIAVFDMDRTVTIRGTYTPFLIFAAGRIAPWRLLLVPAYIIALALHVVGAISRKSVKQTGFRLLIGKNVPVAALRTVAEAFAKRTMERNLFTEAEARIAHERALGRTLVMATAAPEFVANQIGSLLGFDTVIATRHLAAGSDAVSYRIDGENCYGPAKLARLEAWIGDMGYVRTALRIFFYSDHWSDRHVMNWADVAVAVNPGKKLRDLARARDWEVLRFGAAFGR